MDLFEVALNNLAPKVVVGSNENQNSYTLVSFNGLTYANAKLGATGAITSTVDSTMASLQPVTGLFKDGATAPNLSTVSNADLYAWFNSVPGIAKNFAGVATGTISTQLAFCPDNSGNLLAVLANNLYRNSGGTVSTQYNNSVGIAFDKSIVDDAKSGAAVSLANVSLLPTTVVVNCLGGQTVMLKGSVSSPGSC